MTTPIPSPVIAVVGGSGAGKTWLARRLCAALAPHAGLLSLDDFYRDRSHLPPARRARLNFDVPHAIDWTDAARALRDCRAGRPTRIPRYDFSTHRRCDGRADWAPRPIVIVEGLWLLRPPELRRLFDLRLFLDTPAGLRQDRRVARDTEERGYTADAVLERLTTTVLPMHERYVEPQKRWADLILRQPFAADDLAAFATQLWAVVRRTGRFDHTTADDFRARIVSHLVAHEYCN